MLRMVWLILFQLMFLDLSGARQESAQVLTVFDITHEVLQGSTLPTAVWVSEISEVSTSVLMAETWVKTHVLAHYPSNPITTILVGDTILCSEHPNNLSLVLLALKNIHHSLTRWGLEKDIKVSAAFSSGCLDQKNSERFVRPILEFLHATNSTYCVNPPPKVSPFSHETLQLVSSHSETLKKLGFWGIKNIKVIAVTNSKEAKPRTRKLSSIDPFPAKRGITSDLPLHSSVGFYVPANVAKNPPAPTQTASPPVYHQATPPTCRAPAPELKPVKKLWCVAKPTVPVETLLEAVDYACGAGGADCQEIMPTGNCYHPESVVAHASYAFNSYWQKNRRNGGTCSFGGTAMLINTDPSYQLCRFIIT